MEQFIRGLLIDLERRATDLKERVAAIDTDAKLELREHALLAYQYLEVVRRNAAQLVRDPALGNPQLIKNQIQLYKRWSEIASLVEWYPIPFIERYSEEDQSLTRLCHMLAREVRWPLPLPVVGSFSNQYFWTKPEFSIIAAPSDEGFNLLALPDLCHELGHILLLYHRTELAGDFLTDLAAHFQEERRKIDSEERPPEYKRTIDNLFALWNDVWVWEFAADMVATYLAGPPFGWQHLRLTASLGGSAYFPALGDFAEHPADAARMKGIRRALQYSGAKQAASDIGRLWAEYLSFTGDDEPPDYGLCYPSHLIEGLMENVMRGCEQLGLKRFDERAGNPIEIVSIIGEAWEQFLERPSEYGAWEDEALALITAGV